MLNRRTFFSGLASIFPGLFFAGGKLQNENSARDDIERMNREASITIEQIRADMRDSASLETIRWISVDERLPEMCDVDPYIAGFVMRDDGKKSPIVRKSRAILLIDEKIIRKSRFCESADGYIWPSLVGVTHWAEMPKGPRA